ncbi:MAG: ShlB/FhaC/HecB family hemolysin secretion/activation protein [Rickettsiales bacterium]
MRYRNSLSSRFFILAVSTSALTIVSTAAHSQVNIPSTARPEVIQRQIQNSQRPEVTGEQLITVQDKESKTLKGNVSFRLKIIEFNGMTAEDMRNIKPIYEEKLRKDINLRELNEIADKITSYYRNKGFILNRAVVPPQRIKDGVVRINIIQGFVSDVQLKGDVDVTDSILHEYAEKIKESKPLDAKTLERYLLLMEDLPGVEARAVIQPSADTPHASLVTVNIKRNKFEGSTIRVNNRGTRFLGTTQAIGVFAVNNMLGMNEQTAFRVINTPFEPDELKYFGVRHEQPINSYGTKAAIDLSFIETNPGHNLEVLDVEGTNYEVNASISHPIMRSRQSNLFVNTDFSIQRVNLSVLDANIYNDNLRIWTTELTYDFVDETNAVNRLESSFAKGLNWFADSASLPHSRAGGKASFEKFNANFTRIQPVYGSWSISTSVDGQYSLDPLYSAQEYAIGGAQFGSAYDPAEITGDSGIAGRLELQYNGNTENKYVTSFQSYGFYDLGKVWNRNIVANSEPKDNSLASAGIGTRFNILDSLTGDVELAFPLTRDVAAYGADGSAPRIFFNMQYRY